MHPYTFIEKLFAWWNHYRKASTIYDIQHPHLYHVLNIILRYPNKPGIWNQIERERRKLQSSNLKIPHIEYGAGTNAGSSSIRDLNRLVKTGSTSPSDGRKLYALSEFINSSYILELGTQVGIGSSYLMAGNKSSKLYTLEANHHLSQISKNLWHSLELSNHHLIHGTFDNTLSEVLYEMKDLRLVFLDGNHRYQATINYFKTIYPYLGNKSIVILDDIYWSSDMTKAYRELIRLPEVDGSIDLFTKGILFINWDFEMNQHLRIVPQWQKCWHLGINGGKIKSN